MIVEVQKRDYQISQVFLFTGAGKRLWRSSAKNPQTNHTMRHFFHVGVALRYKDTTGNTGVELVRSLLEEKQSRGKERSQSSETTFTGKLHSNKLKLQKVCELHKGIIDRKNEWLLDVCQISISSYFSILEIQMYLQVHLEKNNYIYLVLVSPKCVNGKNLTASV